MLGAIEKVDTIAFDQITSVQLGKGVFYSTIKLRASGYQEDIEAIPKDKAEKIVEYINKIIKNLSAARSVGPQQQPSSLSLADELSKLAKLKEQGILSEAEFMQMKQDLIKKMTETTIPVIYEGLQNNKWSVIIKDCIKTNCYYIRKIKTCSVIPGLDLY